MEKSWFKTAPFTSLEIHEFQSISARRLIRSNSFNDPVLIETLVKRIEQIPIDGDMMISFGPDAEYMTLTFTNDIQEEVVELIQRRFKTPSTGFNSSSPLEKELYEEIQRLLLLNA